MILYVLLLKIEWGFTMKLSKHNARQIVSDINAVIKQNVNIMNDDGLIIASSDQSRIGTYHECAKKIITENLDELIVYYNDEYEGTKNGVNYPIKVRNQTVGVIGVTGAYHEISQIAQIAKRMTEMLVLEIALKEEAEIDENVRSRFLYDWLMGDSQIVNDGFINRGLALNIDIKIPRRIIAVAACTSTENETYEQLKQIDLAEKFLTKRITKYDSCNIYLHMASHIILGVRNRSDKDILVFAENIKSLVETKFPVKLAIGIDCEYSDYLYAHNASMKAYKALQSCLSSNKPIIRFYNDINMEIFSDEITELTKIEYVKQIFRDYSYNEIIDVMRILEIYYEEDGSLCKTADKLYMHKNTLQYKLKQIYEKTGYDPRSLKESSYIYLAIYFMKGIRGNALADSVNKNRIRLVENL